MARIDGTSGNDFLFGTDDDDQVFGLDGDDFLLGFGGNDPLIGDVGDDTLIGGAGDDSLVGGAGADVLTGGAGLDSFSWTLSAGESTASAQDLITAFDGAGAAGGDTLLLSSPPGSRRFVLEGALAVAPTPGAAVGFGGNGFTEVFYAIQGGDTVLIADTNDDGIYDAGDFSVRIASVHNLVKGDLVRLAAADRSPPTTSCSPELIASAQARPLSKWDQDPRSPDDQPMPVLSCARYSARTVSIVSASSACLSLR